MIGRRRQYRVQSAEYWEGSIGSFFYIFCYVSLHIMDMQGTGLVYLVCEARKRRIHCHKKKS